MRTFRTRKDDNLAELYIVLFKLSWCITHRYEYRPDCSDVGTRNQGLLSEGKDPGYEVEIDI